MNAVLDAPPTPLDPASSTPPPVRKGLAPAPFRWTVASFYEVSGMEMFSNRRLMLIDGEILQMPADNPPHATGVALACQRLQQVFGAGFYVRNQAGMPLKLDTDPSPDVVVVPGSIRDYSKIHPAPETIRLIVEVSDSTLHYDLGGKSHLYAAAGIPEYWVVDVNASQLHVHREPVADEAAPRGFRYASVKVLNPTNRVAPLAKPDSEFAVGDLMS
jgi:Uma2 family endonuclease